MTHPARVNIALGILGVFLLGFVGLIIFCLVTEPLGTLAAIGVIVGFFALMWAAMTIGEEL